MVPGVGGGERVKVPERQLHPESPYTLAISTRTSSPRVARKERARQESPEFTRQPMRRRFFVERFDGTTAALRGEAAHHLGRVLRAQPGQLYELSNGEALWLARIERAGRDAVEFALVEPLPARTPNLHVTLLLAITKFDRFEWSLEKATELGVAEIVPLAAARSEKSLVAAASKRAARWPKSLLESAAPSRPMRPPVLQPSARPPSRFARLGARA